jgi:hypothetical protein
MIYVLNLTTTTALHTILNNFEFLQNPMHLQFVFVYYLVEVLLASCCATTNQLFLILPIVDKKLILPLL